MAKNVLFIEDEKDFRQIYVRLMQLANRAWRNEPEGMPYFTQVASPSEADMLLADPSLIFDACILDLTFIPDWPPTRTLEWLSERKHILPPTVVCTGTLPDNIERQCFEAGAADFVYKSSDLENLALEILKKTVYAYWRKLNAQPSRTR